MFSGSMVALVTPFSNTLIDEKAFKKLIDWQIESGTDNICVNGSTGEGLFLSPEDRALTISMALSVSNGRVPIIAGCSSCYTNESIKIVRQAQELGADGVLLIAPYYVKPTQQGIIQHFKTVHDNTNIPIVIYNNPGRCAVDMSLETILEIAKLPRVVALKDSNTDLSRVTILKSRNPELTLLSGDDPSLPGFLAHGGDGCVSVSANIEPALVKGLVSSWNNRDIEMMNRIASRLIPLSHALFVESNPIPVKYALAKKGLIENELRSPLCPASQKTIEILDRLLGD